MRMRKKITKNHEFLGSSATFRGNLVPSCRCTSCFEFDLHSQLPSSIGFHRSRWGWSSFKLNLSFSATEPHSDPEVIMRSRFTSRETPKCLDTQHSHNTRRRTEERARGALTVSQHRRSFDGCRDIRRSVLEGFSLSATVSPQRLISTVAGVAAVSEDGVLQHNPVSRGLFWDMKMVMLLPCGVERGHVELFVVHEDVPEEGFPEIGYLDVGGDPPAENDDAGGEVGPNEEHVEVGDGNNEENGQNVLPAAVDNGGNGQVDEAADVEVGVRGNGQDDEAAAVEVGVVGQMEQGAVDAGATNGENGEVAAGGEVATAVSNEEEHAEEGLENMVNEGEVAHDMGPNHEREAVFCDLGGRAGSREPESNKEGHQDYHDEDVIGDGGGEMNVGAESDEDSDDAEYVPSAEKVDSAEDIHFTDSEEDLDLDDSFFGLEVAAGDKGKGKSVVNEEFEEEGEDSDEADDGYEVGGFHREDAQDEVDDIDRVVFSVYKVVANMANYRWEAGTVYASREEFKEAVTGNAVFTKRGIKFHKVDRKRVIVNCQKGCPFKLYCLR
ncbi:hypothetical protein PIB30_043135 [Stylosanthes scabra]|uniref:Transposase MuDR plant domain-containing protein n=1 Tax=Stylosanthes scabra TaxID=79078 RepID=A0ABU6XGE4_9FABA|nr:hypothetical protein [Stylosanthes scabra]